jgi:hypothetical protein
MYVVQRTLSASNSAVTPRYAHWSNNAKNFAEHATDGTGLMGHDSLAGLSPALFKEPRTPLQDLRP